MTKKELRKISLQYRTLAAQMLKIDSQEEKGCIQAFFNYITATPVLHDYISSCHKEEIDFNALFMAHGNRGRLVLPADQKELIDFEYQLMQYILENKKQLFWYGNPYTSSNKFTDLISAFVRKVFEPFVVALRSYLEICLLDADEAEPEEVPEGTKIFLSYCQKDSDIADLIDTRLGEKLSGRASISRDIRDVAYHESFGKFMRSIQDHDYVILLVSDHYLKSRNCMYEVLEAIKDSRYENRVIFIILRDEDKQYMKSPCEESIAAEVYTTEGQTKYTLFWKEKERELQAQIDEIGNPTYALGQIKEKMIVTKILLDLHEFLAFVRDYNGFSLEKHLSEDFDSMLHFMGFFD